MKNTSRHYGFVRIIKRLNNSKNGNPKFIAYADNGNGHGFSFYTANDSMLGYAIQNYENKYCEITIGTHYNKPTLNTILLSEITQ